MKTNALPFVSIVINNYNYARFLSDAINSALGQAYRNVEVIVVDDGSDDESRQVIERYGDRITPVFKRNGGQASAMNVGWSVARGELIYFLDADDMALPGCVEQVVATYLSSKKQISIIQFRLEVIDRDGVPTGALMPDIEKMQGDEADKLLRQKGSYVFPPTSGNVFSANALKRIMPIPETDYRVCADIYICTLAPLIGRVATIDESLGRYRIHGDNNWALTAGNDSSERVEKFVEMMVNESTARQKSKKICSVYLRRPIGGNTELMHTISKLTLEKLRKTREGDSLQRSGIAMAKTFLSELKCEVAELPIRTRLAAMFYLTTIALLPRRLVHSMVRYTFICPPRSIGLILKKSFGH